MSRLLTLILASTALVVCLALANPVLAQSFSTLEERMTAAEFEAAGLDKLSAEELAALNAWLQRVTVPGTVGSAAESGPLPGQSGGMFARHDGSSVSSRIQGEFRGWTGKTVFHLENGQVWQQVGNDTWRGVRLTNPAISIEPAMLGSWRLRVEGYNTTTKVRRIR